MVIFLSFLYVYQRVPKTISKSPFDRWENPQFPWENYRTLRSLHHTTLFGSTLMDPFQGHGIGLTVKPWTK